VLLGGSTKTVNPQQPGPDQVPTREHLAHHSFEHLSACPLISRKRLRLGGGCVRLQPIKPLRAWTHRANVHRRARNRGVTMTETVFFRVFLWPGLFAPCS
jgi:hypothetical protein